MGEDYGKREVSLNPLTWVIKNSLIRVDIVILLSGKNMECLSVVQDIHYYIIKSL